MRRFYIAGPMSGYPELNFPAFRQAAKHMRAAGIEVISPHEIKAPHGADATPREIWQTCMRADLAQLVTCSDVVMLPGWRASEGATLENTIGRALGLGMWDYLGGGYIGLWESATGRYGVSAAERAAIAAMVL